MDGKAAESFGGMRVVRAFSGQRAETSRFMNTNHLMGRQELNTWWWARTMEVVWGLLIPVGCLGVLLYGGKQVLEGRLTLGDLMMFLTYLLFLLGAADRIGPECDAVSKQPVGPRSDFGSPG